MIKKVEKSNTLLVKVYSTETESCTSSFALINLGDTNVLNTAIEMREVLKKGKEKNSNDSYYQLTAFNSSCLFIGERDDDTTTEEIKEELEEIFEEETYCYVEIDVESLEQIEAINSDIDLILVDEVTFLFSAYIKHTSIKLTTSSISFSFFE